ncbi:MAG TPA: MYXO-CTERM sorting domain-containing protein [Polyangiaceae bacterium]|nr:MYXO-CTERM sorting domain-containing protein [Polyangiaceae bacterium]
MNALNSINIGRLFHKKLWVLFALAVVLLSNAAFAGGGRVQWKSRKVQESDKSWKLEVAFFLSSPPDTSLVPVRFSFTPVSYFERALVDNHDGPVTRVVPLTGRQPLVESVDIGFLDPGTGKVEPRTRFNFRITRERGFEAGEYDVEIRYARTDQLIGTKQTITLDGENDVIDRRAMDFSGKEPPKKAKKTEDTEPRKAREYSPDDPAYWEGGPKESAPKEEDRPPPASMREGGCGCRVAGMPTGSEQPWAPFALAALGIVAAGRRRTARLSQ